MESTYNFDDIFEHKTLDKIYGEPDTKSLQKLFKQLKRNARSVTSPLGGGQYGHLFMVIPDEEWRNLPGTTPVISPTDPGPFRLEGRLTAAEIAVHQKAHEEAKKKYNKYQALHRVLRNQLVSAIEPCYLDPIRCELTDMVNAPITEIITFLQDSYGKMTVNEIEQVTTNIKNFAYDPSKSINILITAIQEHADLLKIAGAGLKDKQIQDLAFFLINKYQIFKDALINWNKIAEPKTWENMKIHLRNEYQVLKNVNALSISESILNTTDIVEQLKDYQENLLHNAETRFKTGLTEVMNLAIMDLSKEKDTTPEAPSEHANSTAEIMALKQEIKNLQAQMYNRGNNSITRNFQFQSRQPRRNARFTRQFYCWTHGAGHSGRNCMNPAEGHQPDATFTNRMGGNNLGCYPTRPRRYYQNNSAPRKPKFNNNDNLPPTNTSGQH